MTSLQDRDRQFLWHPFTQAATAPDNLEVIGACGASLELADGRRILDAISSWWTNIHGHGHPKIAEAIAQQALTLDHVIFAGCTHPLAVDVAERVLRLAPNGLSRVFYSDNGSTSVEVGLKMVFQYWRNQGAPKKRQFVALEHGYHGDTVGAMSVGDPNEFVAPFRSLLFDVHHIPTPDLKTTEGECLARLDQLLQRESPNIAGMILEPMVQGAGGMRIHSPNFLREMARLCKEYEVLLIADEVMTGFGRTGKMFACEHAGISPDVLCIAKGLTGGVIPLAATLATEELYAGFLGPNTKDAFLHGHSFTANPIACAAAMASLQLLEEENILQRVEALSQIYSERLPPFTRYPQVQTVRWLGGIGVVEFVPNSGEGGYYDPLSTRLREYFLRHDILIRPLGNVFYVLPPYVISPDELHRVFDLLEQFLSQ